MINLLRRWKINRLERQVKQLAPSIEMLQVGDRDYYLIDDGITSREKLKSLAQIKIADLKSKL